MKSTLKLLAGIAICIAIANVAEAHDKGSPKKILLIEDSHDFIVSFTDFTAYHALTPVEQFTPLVKEFKWNEIAVKVYEHGTAGYYIAAANRNLKVSRNLLNASSGGVPYGRC